MAGTVPAVGEKNRELVVGVLSPPLLFPAFGRSPTGGITEPVYAVFCPASRSSDISWES